MSVKVLLPNAFHKHTNGAREISSEASNLPALVDDIETHFPALKQHLRDGNGKLRQFINFYVNDEDIRFLGNDKYSFKDGDEVLVIPSIAGGCAGNLAKTQVSESRPGAPSACSCCSYCGLEDCSCG
jgi:sulfur-carrier protein